ncbi:homeodomain-interacting protein kinase 1-like [Trachinotus anak]|uniref:homeodomain-interacting protein kinase 1-like n=1 Tax=Trachinotus anak TaxID=443729 RepID=UPI0039F1C385
MMKWHIWENICCGNMPSSSHSASCLTADKTGTASLSALTDKEKKSESSEVLINDILCSSTSRYLITEFNGEGRFGKVTKGINLTTSQDVALKMLKAESSAEREIKMLEVVSVLDPVKKNVVQFFEKFKHKGRTCLVFELLDRSLFQLFSERHWKPLAFSEIRPIAQQLLMALDALKGIGVIHSDLKPDNIMLANHLSEPFRVKLIDFGLSFTTSNKRCGMRVQPLGYRAPEVTLGLSIYEAIDMWGLGCVLSFLYLAKHLFAIHCEYQSMRGIIDILGQPADHLLCAGRYTHKFFKVNQHWNNQRWQIKTPREYQLGTGTEPKRWMSPFRNLQDLIKHKPEMQESIELEDQRAFVSLLKSLLHTDPERRITPEKALSHPFVTMAHLVDRIDTSLYVKDSLQKMLVCPMDDLDEALSPDGEAEEKPKGEKPTAIPHSVAGSAVPCSYDGVKNMPKSSDRAEGAAVIDASGSAVWDSTVSQGAASTAEGTSAYGGSPVESPPQAR